MEIKISSAIFIGLVCLLIGIGSGWESHPETEIVYYESSSDQNLKDANMKLNEAVINLQEEKLACESVLAIKLK